MGIVEEEADESSFWLELLEDRTARGPRTQVPRSAFRVPR